MQFSEQAHSSPDAPVHPLEVEGWHAAPDEATRRTALVALEQGKVLLLPRLSFVIEEEEKHFLSPEAVDPRGKSVKYAFQGDRLWGDAVRMREKPALQSMMRRYAESSRALVAGLFPGYAAHLRIGNTSFRPVPVEGRAQTPRQDDSRLHVDAFPSRPSGGERLLRVFSNIDPDGAARHWQLGEPFAAVAQRFVPDIRPPFPGSATLLHWMRLTKTRRSPYDHYMLQLHDRMKQDDRYQAETAKTELAFPAAGSWIVFTDQVSHAAISGRHAMEQTFVLPAEALEYPELSPLRILESLCGRSLLT